MANWIAIALFVTAAVVISPRAQACTIRIRADGNTAAIQQAMDKPGRRVPIVCLEPGVYKGARLVATRSAVLRRVGQDKVVFDAGAQGRVLTVAQDNIEVRLEGITLTNGKAEQGGAVALIRASRLTLQDCWIYANTATLHGGGAIFANSGQLDLVRTRITGNSGDRAAAIDLTGVVQARLFATLVADNEARGTSDAPIRLTSSAQLHLEGATVAYNSGSGVVLQPDGPGRRKLTVVSSIIMGKPDAITVQRAEADAVRVESSVLWGGFGFVALDLASQRALPSFNLKLAERYRPETGSVAIGLGRCVDRLAKLDLTGKPRGRVCTAGALEAPPAEFAATMALRRKQPAVQKKPKDWRDI